MQPQAGTKGDRKTKARRPPGLDEKEFKFDQRSHNRDQKKSWSGKRGNPKKPHSLALLARWQKQLEEVMKKGL